MAQLSLPSPTDRGPDPASPPLRLSRRAKAAIVVQFLLKEGADVPLQTLPQHLQAELTQQLGSMRTVDRATLRAVMQEFADDLDAIGLRFPGGLSDALVALDGRVDPATARHLRRTIGAKGLGDPWKVLCSLPAERLRPLAEQESAEIAAVLISKLPTDQAAALLGLLPGPRARQIAFAVSLTGNVTPEAVTRIGQALLDQLDGEPERAFTLAPEDRVGAILNSASSAMRDTLLDGLRETDETFAEAVRGRIFIFANIPDRVDPMDVPKIMRDVDGAIQISAFAGAHSALNRRAADFLMDNMSKRMAETLRGEIADAKPATDEDADRAMTQIVGVIRRLDQAGEIALKSQQPT